MPGKPYEPQSHKSTYLSPFGMSEQWEDKMTNAFGALSQMGAQMQRNQPKPMEVSNSAPGYVDSASANAALARVYEQLIKRGLI